MQSKLFKLIILQLDPMELNNTRKAKKDILFFNRVPKVGIQHLLYLGRIIVQPSPICTVMIIPIYSNAGGKPNNNGAVKIAFNKEQVPLPQGPNAEG